MFTFSTESFSLYFDVLTDAYYLLTVIFRGLLDISCGTSEVISSAFLFLFTGIWMGLFVDEGLTNALFIVWAWCRNSGYWRIPSIKDCLIMTLVLT